jgi:hypothetical protein
VAFSGFVLGLLSLFCAPGKGFLRTEPTSELKQVRVNLSVFRAGNTFKPTPFSIAPQVCLRFGSHARISSLAVSEPPRRSYGCIWTWREDLFVLYR